MKTTTTTFARVGRRSVVDQIFEQLRGRILSGDLEPGQALPSEQELAEALGVSRPAVREALNRLAAERLLTIAHGAGKKVLDYRRSAGLELLSALLVTADGKIDPDIVCGMVEMRSAIAPDVARLAAERRAAAVVARLRAVVARMEGAEDDLVRLQDLAEEFWSELVDGSGNVAYRLAYNSLRATYDVSKRLLTGVLAAELGDVARYREIAVAVADRDAQLACELARELIVRGERSLKAFLGRLPAKE
jgi:GntR family transcriptional regulator, transcriptional repressor for pyruvate dehydrogenase complex